MAGKRARACSWNRFQRAGQSSARPGRWQGMWPRRRGTARSVRVRSHPSIWTMPGRRSSLRCGRWHPASR